jgi:hypothetical protein
VNEVAFRKATIQLYEKRESISPKSDNPAIDIHTKNTSENTSEVEADACAGSASPSPSPAPESLLFPLQEKELLTNKRTTKTPNPPISPAPLSPAALLMAAYVELLKEYEPKATINYARERDGINKLAKQDVQPEELKLAYRTLKADTFWQAKHISSQSLGTQIGAILARVEDKQVTMELTYAW